MCILFPFSDPSLPFLAFIAVNSFTLTFIYLAHICSSYFLALAYFCLFLAFIYFLPPSSPFTQFPFSFTSSLSSSCINLSGCYFFHFLAHFYFVVGSFLWLIPLIPSSFSFYDSTFTFFYLLSNYFFSSIFKWAFFCRPFQFTFSPPHNHNLFPDPKYIILSISRHQKKTFFSVSSQLSVFATFYPFMPLLFTMQQDFIELFQSLVWCHPLVSFSSYPS